MTYLLCADSPTEGQTLFLAECDSQEAAEMLVMIEHPSVSNIELMSEFDSILGIDYKAKYEKAIKIIRRFDAGIIGMYDL